MMWNYRQGLSFLIGSMLFTLGISLSGYAIWNKWRLQRLQDDHYHIVSIIQTGPEKEALKTSYLAELLDISRDRPVSLYAFDIRQAEKKIRACPLIAQAALRRLAPGTLYIDYTVRKPIAWLGDYQNIGLDREGYLFPIAPFFSPKHLPEIYLGLPPFEGNWQLSLQNNHLRLAFEILQALDSAPWQEGMRLTRIDVSNAFASSYGQREIVLLTEEELSIRVGEKEVLCLFPKILRLTTKGYSQQLSNFLALRRQMLEDYKRQINVLQFASSPVRFSPRIVDLRIEQLAFVQNQAL